MKAFIGGIDRGLGRLLAAVSWLAIPLSLLLFLQWPLRDLVHAGSWQANDVAQCLYALYAALAVTEATRRRSHLASRALAPRWAARRQRALGTAALLLALLPWSAFVLISCAPQVWRSVAQLEAFPESFHPGYFVVKIALALLAAAVAVQALIDLLRLRAEKG